MTRVAVVSDSPVLRAGLQALLGAEPGLIVVGAIGEQAADGHAAPLRELVSPLDPDVVVWAPDPAGRDGVLRALRDDAPADDAPLDDAPSRLPVVLLLDRADRRLAARALRAGAHAVLPLDADADAVLAATQAAAAGLVTVPHALAGDLLAAAGAADVGTAPADGAAAEVAPLTPREREVLALLAQGLANKQVASRLGITEHTVKAHVAAIYEKLHAGNRAEAVVAAARRGLLLL